MNKIIKIDNELNLMIEGENNQIDIYSAKDLMIVTALNLAEDVSNYRKGEKDLLELITIETSALTALANAVNAMK
nr:MAG TPA: hypothetical protein [Caudoviricetes sp.]